MGNEREVMGTLTAWSCLSWAGKTQPLTNADGPKPAGNTVIERNAALSHDGAADVVAAVVVFERTKDAGPARASQQW